jgi:predicted DNA-binding protein (UPF0251 family)
MLTKDEITKWLYEIRHLNKLKRYHLNEIDNIKLDCERIREGKAAIMCLAKVQTSNISNPTEQQAIVIVDKYGEKVNYHIIEIDRIDCHIYKAKMYLEGLYHKGIISIEEFECLNYYFFEGMSDYETGIAMKYSERQAQRIKKSAIENMSLNVVQLLSIMVS